MAEWTRIANSTIHEYSREVEENIMRNRKLPALMRSNGRISFNHAGDLMDWKVRYKRAAMRGFADSDTLTFSRVERLKTAQLEWRGYAATDSATKLEKLKNKNTEAIVKVFAEMAEMLMADMEDNFADEFYIDGNAPGNGKRIHGIESFMGAGSVSANGFVATPSDTYAGLVTNLGNYGGTWSLNGANVAWPTGVGDSHYDFWSPVLVSYTNASWRATTKTWPNTCKEALRYGIIKSRRNKSNKGSVKLVTLNDELYRQFEDTLEDKERIVVTRGEKGGLVALGFTDTINWEGIDHTFEYGIPDGVGYGWATESMELCSLQGQLFVPEGPDFDIASQSYRLSIDFFGNMKFNPRYFVKWAAYG